MRDISVRKRGKRMPCARHIERDCIDLEQLHTALSANTCPAPSERGGTQRCLRDLDALAYRQPLAVATFRWSPVSSFGYLCREERGAPWPPGRRQCGCRRARIALSVCAAHRSGNREASARTRCARMACRVQWRASVSWRCLKTLGMHSALMPATCRDANEAQESNVRIQ